MSTTLQLTSLVTEDSEVRLSLEEREMPQPKADEVLVEVIAAPINPSDIGVLLAGADLSSMRSSGTATHPVLTATIPEAAFNGLQTRVGAAMPVGNEGSGRVIGAGSSKEAQALLGKAVGMRGGAMYGEHRCLPASSCMALPDEVDPKSGASMTVNPLTVLGMVATMRNEGHVALVHTAAASNLGQMLNKVCMADGIALVNVVRKESQVELLRSLGATYVVNSTLPTFADDLYEALVETGATLCFDATGGGELAGQILAGMEAALNANADSFSRYGSATHKQVYIYGGLDRSPIVLHRGYGMKWGIGGWLLTYFLASLNPKELGELRQRVVDEIETTFSSSYTGELSLVAALDPINVAAYAEQATGAKYLITPQA